MSVELELPGWYVDALVFDDLGTAPGASYFEIVGRVPSPGAVDVRADAEIVFQLITDTGDAPTSNFFAWVSVDGGPEVLAYDGGGTGLQPGFDGPDSSEDSIGIYTVGLHLDPTTDFGSLQVITVRVYGESTNGQILDTSWSFTVEDTTPPVLEKATGRDALTVRVTFDEPVNQDDTTSAASALTPSNYVFAASTAPAVPIAASSVEVVDASTVDITLDTEMTRGASYLLTVSNVEDILGNAIAAPYNTATFSGYVCPVPDGRSFDLYQTLSQTTREDDPGDLADYVACLQEVTDLLLCKVDEWTNIIDPDIAPEVYLDAMLTDLGNPFGFDLSENDKRRLIRILVVAYKQKGTEIGIINLVRFFLGIEVTIQSLSEEGWDLGVDLLGETTILGPGTQFALYSFEVVSPQALTDEERDRITEIAEYMKPAHTHLVQIVEPTIPTIIDHLELGLSEMGDTWILH